MTTKSWLASASALAALICAGNAQAAAPVIVYGGGGSSPAKVYRDIFNCYVTLANGIYATTPGNPSTAAYPTGPNTACSTQGTANDLFPYESINATAGLTAFTEVSPVPLGTPSSTNTIAYLDSTFGVTGTPYPQIQFAASDIYLNSTEATQAATTAGEPIFQIPTFVTPFALGVGQLQNVKLTTKDVCDIFSGATDVSAAKVTFSEIVVRSDSSAASFVLSDFLAQNCSASLGFNSSNGFPSAQPSWSAVVAQNGGNITIVSGKGSGGEAAAIAATPNALGYVTVDYAYPVVPTSTVFPAYLNGNQPTVTAVKNHLLHEVYPSTYNAATVGQQLNDQLVAPGGTGYDLVSFSFLDVYQCYSTSFGGGLIGGPAQGKALLAVIKNFYNAKDTPILTASGFVAAPAAINTLLKSAGGPLAATGGLQNTACPKT